MTTSNLAIGRADHHERREYRSDRLHERADNADAKAAANEDSARSVASCMNGTPVLIGHHSEARHRRDLDRMHNQTRTAIDERGKAERLRNRANHPSTSISGDDPDAIEKLESKLADLEGKRAQIKAESKAARKGDATVLAKLDQAYARVNWHDTSKGHPPYVLTNLSGKIRAATKRLDTLKSRVGREAREETVGEWTLRENPSTNRVELAGPRPSPEQKADLKNAGWRWSRQNTVWQRQCTEAAWSSALYLTDRWAAA